MGKKIREFLKDIATKGGIKSADLEGALAASGLNDLELPDDYVTGFDAAYMTPERAKNDPNIVAEIVKGSNRSVLNSIDEKIMKMDALIDKEDFDAIKKEERTLERMDMLKAALRKAQQANKGKLNEDANKIQEELNKQIAELKAAHKAELERQKEEINTAITDGVVTQKILAFKFADAFNAPEMRNTVANLVKTNIRQKFALQLEKGELKLLTKVGDSMVEAFEGNEKLTVDKLLDRELEKFIAKSNGNGQQSNGNGATPPTGGTLKVPDLNTATLADMRKIAAIQQ